MCRTRCCRQFDRIIECKLFQNNISVEIVVEEYEVLETYVFADFNSRIRKSFRSQDKGCNGKQQ